VVDKEDGKVSYSEFRVKFLETFSMFWSIGRTEKSTSRNSGKNFLKQLGYFGR
jgi:hypothetical protein